MEDDGGGQYEEIPPVGVPEDEEREASSQHSDNRHYDGAEVRVQGGAGLLEDGRHEEHHGGDPRPLCEDVEEPRAGERSEECGGGESGEEAAQTSLSLVLALLLPLVEDHLLYLLLDVVLAAAVPLQGPPGLLLPLVLHQPVWRLPAGPHAADHQEGARRADPRGGPPVTEKAQEVDLPGWECDR